MPRYSMHHNSEERKARQLELEAMHQLIEESLAEEVFDPEAGKPTDDPFPEELAEIDYSTMTVAELKALCSERGLAQYGTKAELIERLTSESTEAPVEETAVEEDTATPEESAVATENQEGEVSESEGGETEE